MTSITVWTQLIPEPTQPTLERGLQAQLGDPLWLLGRQDQLREFEGDDAGSPALATLRCESVPLTRYRPGLAASSAAGPFAPLSAALPLEVQVECEPVSLGVRGAVQLGRQFEALMTAAGRASDIAAFRAAFPIVPNPPPNELPDVSSQQFRTVVAGRVTDGNALYSACLPAPAGTPSASLLPAIAHQTDVSKVLEEFVAYRQSLYTEPAEGSSWVSERLEYAFSVASQGPTDAVQLNADTFPGGRLDWYSFALNAAPGSGAGQQGASVVTTEAVVPTHITFDGMPGLRWWSFEDAQTDFGKVETEQVDLLKLLVLEFGVIYGASWFELPLRLPVGTRSKITALVVTDTFGERTLIRPSALQAPALARQWSLFAVSQGNQRGDFLLLPPVLSGVLDGPPVEDVLFVRDDAAAMAWAIERSLQGPLDQAIDAYESSLLRKSAVPAPPTSASSTPPATPAAGADITYRVGNSVQDWIPLVPVKTPTGALLLRRGKMEYETPGGLVAVPARSQVLEPGHPLFLDDASIARAGTRVVRYMRLACGIDGSRYTWAARKTLPGQGIGWSGLAFDLVESIRTASGTASGT